MKGFINRILSKKQGSVSVDKRGRLFNSETYFPNAFFISVFFLFGYIESIFSRSAKEILSIAISALDRN